MADLLNTLGFISWGMLGVAEGGGGEGPGQIIYVLDMGVEVEMAGLDAEVDLTDLQAIAEIPELAVAADLGDIEVAVELENEEE